MSNAIRTRTVVTTNYEAELPDGRVIDLPLEASDFLDAFLSDDGTTFRYATHYDACNEWEWPEGVEFVQANPRNLHYVSDAEGWLEDVNSNPNLVVFPVGVYEHGNVSYSLAGESIHSGDQWDYCVGACIAIPSGPEGYTDPEAAARAILDEYSAWCNGDTYGIVELSLDPETGEPVGDYDAVYGIFGWEQAEACVKTGV